MEYWIAGYLAGVALFTVILVYCLREKNLADEGYALIIGIVLFWPVTTFGIFMSIVFLFIRDFFEMRRSRPVPVNEYDSHIPHDYP